MKLEIVLMLVFTSAGCGNAAERCNAGKVGAYDAWEAVAVARERLAAVVVEEQIPPDVGRTAATNCDETGPQETLDAFEARCLGGAAPTPAMPSAAGTAIAADCLQPRSDESFDAFEARPSCDVGLFTVYSDATRGA